MIPETDDPVDARASFLAFVGSDTAFLFASTAQICAKMYLVCELITICDLVHNTVLATAKCLSTINIVHSSDALQCTQFSTACVRKNETK